MACVTRHGMSQLAVGRACSLAPHLCTADPAATVCHGTGFPPHAHHCRPRLAPATKHTNLLHMKCGQGTALSNSAGSRERHAAELEGVQVPAVHLRSSSSAQSLSLPTQPTNCYAGCSHTPPHPPPHPHQQLCSPGLLQRARRERWPHRVQLMTRGASWLPSMVCWPAAREGNDGPLR